MEPDFLFLTGVPPVVIREAEHLILRPFLFFFFSLKSVRDIYLCNWLLESQLCLKLSSIPTPLTAPGALWIGGACKYWWPSCSYRKCPQGGRISPCPTRVPPATRALGKVGFLVYEWEWNAWANFQRLVSHYFFPLTFHSVSPPDSSKPGHCSCRGPERLGS